MKSKSRSKIILMTLILLAALAVLSIIFRSSHVDNPPKATKQEEQIKDNTQQDYSDFGTVDSGGTD